MITLLTDFGANSIYATQAQVWLKSREKNLEIVDISHQIHACDINEAAYVLELMIQSFPENTVHIVAVDFDERHEQTEIVHFRWKGQHILTYNNGFASLCLKSQDASSIHLLGSYDGAHLTSVPNVFGQHALDLIHEPQNDKTYSIADQAHIKTALQPVSNGESLIGHVLYFDARGTAYTNITQNDIEAFAPNGGVSVVLSRHERLDKISNGLQYNEGGSTFCYFNGAGYLTIEMHRGTVKSMYGLQKGQKLVIEKR
ncbi:MAG: SAM-dependent chlorinase/fluorinase [Bacteroidia bacterium]|nr:SAM-dependent chlorinase/fluorinase [Bacteroidia bacterium]